MIKLCKWCSAVVDLCCELLRFSKLKSKTSLLKDVKAWWNSRKCELPTIPKFNRSKATSRGTINRFKRQRRRRSRRRILLTKETRRLVGIQTTYARGLCVRAVEQGKTCIKDERRAFADVVHGIRRRNDESRNWKAVRGCEMNEWIQHKQRSSISGGSSKTGRALWRFVLVFVSSKKRKTITKAKTKIIREFRDMGEKKLRRRPKTDEN